MAKKAGLVWIDAQGQRVLSVISTDAGVGDIETALEAHSNAAIIECWEGIDETYSVFPVTDPLPTVRTQAVLYFRNLASGSQARLFIPAPETDIFLSDGLTVDPAQIADVIAAAEANLLAGDGSIVDSFVGGQLYQTPFSGIATFDPP